MPDGICYRGYKLSRQGDEFYASLLDPSEPPIMIVSRSIAKLCKRIDEMWVALATEVHPTWVTKWLEGNDPRIDPDTLDMLDTLIGTMSLVTLDDSQGEVATYTTDAAGIIDFFNEAAVRLWGYRPEVGKTRWGGAFRLLDIDGVTEISVENGPMAIALKELRPLKGIAAIIERPDGSRTPVKCYPSPLKGEDGTFIGAINYLVPITQDDEFDVIRSEFSVVRPIRAALPSKATPM